MHTDVSLDHQKRMLEHLGSTMQSARRYRRAVEAVERKAEAKLAERAQDIVFMIADGKSNDEVKAAIIAAMKWAQTQ